MCQSRRLARTNRDVKLAQMSARKIGCRHLELTITLVVPMTSWWYSSTMICSSPSDVTLHAQRLEQLHFPTFNDVVRIIASPALFPTPHGSTLVRALPRRASCTKCTSRGACRAIVGQVLQDSSAYMPSYTIRRPVLAPDHLAPRACQLKVVQQ
ncbi:hypothetical protein L226DRAFT_9765 [Lentinus tigrinus ALCF2SS1-7]|uniref:uncharacterized protein n=1 Tax=Lentinus tigrinus ALCF2SS1-7 TaxID=1328758 RepID=UPI0011662FB4|nr:hypothetical protein L226DRAFT_9765 [Lentinus tigrinus ALCF2SS1-7]